MNTRTTLDGMKQKDGLRELVLWRHAEAQDWVPGCDDLQRALTARGEKQAKRMAHWLGRHLPQETRILVSPARRCEQTALALGRNYMLRSELAPDSGVDELLELLESPGAKGTLLVVGHQPTLGQAIAQLIGLLITECAVKKGAVWWLRLRDPGVISNAVLVAVQSPEML